MNDEHDNGLEQFRELERPLRPGEIFLDHNADADEQEEEEEEDAEDVEESR